MATSFVGVWGQVLKLLQDAARNAASSADPSVCSKVEQLKEKLKSLPPPPKAAWKKVVRDMQVPLQLGLTFCRAAQHGTTSRALAATLEALAMLLDAAIAAGHATSSGAVGPLGVSMRQQLQQAGVLPQLAQLMAALAADLRTEAAALGSKSSEQLCSSMGTCYHRHVLQHLLLLITPLYPYLQSLWGCSTKTSSDNSTAWLADASGHAEAAMQLCTAALQHVSSMLQYVVPAVQQRAPQLAARLRLDQAAAAGALIVLSSGMMLALVSQHQGGASTQTGQEVQARQQLPRVLLSPHCLPCIASLLVLSASYLGQEPSRAQPVDGRHGQTSGSSSSSSSGVAGVLTPCQLQLLELLGLSPQVAAAAELTAYGLPTRQAALSALLTIQFPNIIAACSCCFTAACAASCSTDQHWRHKQQLWMLLPALLVTCANNCMLLAAAGSASQDPQQQHFLITNSSGLIQLSQKAVMAGVLLRRRYGSPTAASGCEPPQPGWLEEVLGGVLQLAGQLLPAQQHQPATPTPKAAAAGTSRQGSNQGSRQAATAFTTSCGSSGQVTSKDQVESIAALVDLLGLLVAPNLLWSLTGNSSTASPELACSNLSDSAAATSAAVTALRAAAGVATPSSPQRAVATRLVEVCATLEAGLRAVTAAVQTDPASTFRPALITMCVDYLFVGRIFRSPETVSAAASGHRGHGVAWNPSILMHLGCVAPGSSAASATPTVALSGQLRQLYSLLNTVLKLGQCQSAVVPGQLCWGQEAADTCCWVAGVTAACLLQLSQQSTDSAAAYSAPPQLQSAAAAAKQLLESEFLPSLVIIGRCCLVWAKQLWQQASDASSELQLLLAAGAAGAQQEPGGGVLAKHGAAWVCIPGVEKQEDAAAAAAVSDSPPLCRLEVMVSTLSAWVGGVTSPAAQAALAAATAAAGAGGDSPQQLVQQLEALTAAQRAVRQGLSDASLSALVQQLQATGVMLSSIAVPHFCNNPACGNITGPTDAQLVSGRSCLCGGCRTARYCGRTCQRAAWPQHKRVCKALAAAAAATVSAGAAAAGAAQS